MVDSSSPLRMKTLGRALLVLLSSRMEVILVRSGPTPGDFGTLEACKLPSVRLELGRTGLDVTPDLSFPANDRGGLPSGLQPTTQSNDNVRFQRWHGPGSTWTGFEPIDFLGNPRKRPLAYLPEEPPRSWSPDLLESQHRNNLGISIPPQPPNNYHETPVTLPLFLDNPTTKKRKHDGSSKAPGMMADDFEGWNFPDEISGRRPVSDSAWQNGPLRVEPSTELALGFTGDLRHENMSPHTDAMENAGSPVDVSHQPTGSVPDVLQIRRARSKTPPPTGSSSSPIKVYSPRQELTPDSTSHLQKITEALPPAEGADPPAQGPHPITESNPDLTQTSLAENQAPLLRGNTHSPPAVRHPSTESHPTVAPAGLQVENEAPSSSRNTNSPAGVFQPLELTPDFTQGLRFTNKRPRTARNTNPNKRPSIRPTTPGPKPSSDHHNPSVSGKNVEYFNIFGAEDGDGSVLGLRPDPSEDVTSKAERIKYFQKRRGDKTMVWILGNTLYSAEQDAQRLKSEYALTLTEFNNVFASKIEDILNEGHPLSSDISRKRDIHQLVLQFSDILWVNNLRLLTSLGVLKAKESLMAHALVYRWLLSCEKDDLDYVVEIFKVALTLKPSKEKIYRMIKKKNKGVVVYGTISQTQALLTEAVVFTLATYYHTINREKWESVFGTIAQFVSHVVKTQTESFHSLIRDSRATMKQIKLFPWANDFHEANPHDSPGSLVQFQRVHRVKLDRYIHEEPRLGGGDNEEIGAIPLELAQLGDVDSDQMGNAGNRARWGWISIITRRKITMDQPLTVDSTATMLKMKEFRMGNLDKNTHFAHKTISENGFLERVQVFLNLLLGLNQRFIETLGHRPTDPLYLEEQDKLQTYFLHVISSSPKSLSSRLESDEEAEPGKVKFIQELIFKALASSSLPRHTEAEITVSEQDIIRTEAAAKLLVYYYHQTNYIKWRTLFDNVDNFFRSLEKIEKRTKAISIYGRFYKESFPEMEKAKLLPWSNPFITTREQRSVMALIFRANHYSRGPSKKYSKKASKRTRVKTKKKTNKSIIKTKEPGINIINS
ncbi:hypothetical protein MJO29_013744 [Puccinia striiformis f. sp. tritici]|nr:hypothetical protein Pst134EA_025594 [Puccinia striiformis f. sp. tritici]KAH9451650.1 hypothetical protein Pst134EA_025594 [Puccinia striiformis f. sp. tritici]KAI7941670.1 hypothetical protein MJO29_013744 [Puccinia striiformis f. sp. tritici]